jgi:class 3 adenylate cyclase
MRYKERFQNLFRITRKITSSLQIGDILEMIRDEVKLTVPQVREACLLILDPEAQGYTRPLHCAVYSDRINCQLCKRGRETVQKAIGHLSTYEFLYGSEPGTAKSRGPQAEKPTDLALPIYDGQKPVAVLDLIAGEGYRFNERDVALLRDLVDLAAHAILNARDRWKMSQKKLTLDRILGHLSPFVPETVKRIVEKDPSAPSLEKQDLDVSILFLDVAGYTRISESLSQEKVNFIIEKYFSSFLDVLYAHGGDINETAGDGLMVIFRGEVRKNALNAARAALEISKKTSEHNRELKGRFQPIELNMGINSGTASVGMTKFQGATGTRMTFTASGPVTNLAARIASAARDGDILLGPETARRIDGEIAMYDRGVVHFKNVKEGVRVFSLMRPREAS